MWYTSLIVYVLVFLILSILLYILYNSRKRNVLWRQETPIIQLDYVPLV